MYTWKRGFLWISFHGSFKSAQVLHSLKNPKNVQNIIDLKRPCQWFLQVLLRQVWDHKKCDNSVNPTVQLLL